jgi:hypothetical protein
MAAEVSDPARFLDPFKKEAKFREEVLAAFYKIEEDFENTELYDDYLVEVEDMVHALCHGEDMPAVRAKLAQYKRNWGELSAVNRSRRAEALKQICAAEDRERMEFEQRCAEKLEAEKRRLAGLHSEKQRAQLNISDGRAMDPARATGAASGGGYALTERELFVDPAALPARMREKKQETQQATAQSRDHTTEAAAIAAGCAQRSLLVAMQQWSFQAEALAFTPPEHRPPSQPAIENR